MNAVNISGKIWHNIIMRPRGINGARRGTQERENIMDCVFCSIAAGDIPSVKVYEDEHVLAFKDINPQAPVHIVFIPKKHVMSSLDDYDYALHADVIARIFAAIVSVARDLGLTGGYRIINNCGKDAGQTVQHLHFHLLAGTDMGEKLL